MSTNNIRFYAEIRNLLSGYPVLSAAMYVCSNLYNGNV